MKDGLKDIYAGLLAVVLVGLLSLLYMSAVIDARASEIDCPRVGTSDVIGVGVNGAVVQVTC